MSPSKSELPAPLSCDEVRRATTARKLEGLIRTRTVPAEEREQKILLQERDANLSIYGLFNKSWRNLIVALAVAVVAIFVAALNHENPVMAFVTACTVVFTLIVFIPLGFELIYRHTLSRSRATALGYNSHWLQVYDGKRILMRIYWDHITAVHYFYAAGKPKEEQAVCIHIDESQSIQVRLNRFRGPLDEKEFMEMLAKNVSDRIEGELIEPIEEVRCQPECSYTELWFEALLAAPTRSRLTPLLPGSTLRGGAYEIVTQLGHGGQGTAYIAARSSTGPQSEISHVVLKEYVLPAAVNTEAKMSALRDLEHEAKLLQELHHPGIVKLMGFFVEDHRGYLVMELCNGDSLRDTVEKVGALDASRVASIAVEICTILDYLHSLDPPVVHRDLSPDNLIETIEGTVKLIDFNVALQTGGKTAQGFAGKHCYMAPEQVRGQATAQADIYAMGATLYFLLTGENPSPLSQSRPKQLLPSVPCELDDIVARATALNLSDRYQSVREIKAELQHYLQLPVS